MNHIAQLGRLAGDLEQRRIRVLVIGRSDGEAARETADAFAGRLDVLDDADLAVYKLYGFGKVALVVQRSGTVLVDRTRVVRYVHRVANPKTSLELGELQAQIDSVT